MCLYPIKINKPRIAYSPLRVVRDLYLSAAVRKKVVPTERNEIVVGCGKCVECLKRKQNDLAVRCVREAERAGNMVFLTLTYNDEHLPIFRTDELVSTETGEVSVDRCSRCSDDSDARAVIFSQIPNKFPRYAYQENPSDFADCICRSVFTPSLFRRDFQLYLKKKRVEYKRKHNESLPDFKYVAVGEYGPKTCRPHMHVAFFGLSLNLVLDLFKQWSEEIGYIVAKQVKCFNEDGSYGFQIASKYIGKYMCKGKFDCKSVIDGYSEKPRICISRDFGCELTQQLIDYYTCQNLFGRYDLNDISKFSEWQLNILVKELNNRSHYNINGLNYSLPINMKRRLFYRKMWLCDGILKINKPSKDERKKYEKVEVRYEATQLQSYRLALLEHSDLDFLIGEFRQSFPDANSKVIGQMLQSYFTSQSATTEIRRAMQEKNFLEGYRSDYQF